MNSQRNLNKVLLFVIFISTVSGSLFIGVSFFLPVQKQPIFWYLQDSKIFKYNPQTQTSKLVVIPSQGAIKRPLLSNDGQQIAYSDDEGLKITSLPSATTYLLKANSDVMSGTIVLATKSYFPEEWSPDSKNLIFFEFYVDSDRLYLWSMQDKSIRDIGIGCSGKPSWSPNNEIFALSFFGMGPCEGRGGVYTVSANNLALKQIYHPKLVLGPGPSDGIEGGTSGVKWSPLGDRIAITQVDREGTPRSSRLLLLTPSGDEILVLINSIGDFGNLLWSPNGTEIYYILDEDVRIIKISTRESRSILSAPDIYLNSVSSNNQWLAIQLWKRQSNSTSSSVLLVNTSNSKILRIENASAIGWEMAMP